jgi:HSP20 family molecular chaperone IbpA
MRKTLFEEFFEPKDRNLVYPKIKDSGDVYTATLELAGFSKENVKVSVSDDTLRIEAKKDSKVRRSSIRLKNLVSIESIKSKMDNGLLILTLPKKEVSESLNIEVE